MKKLIKVTQTHIKRGASGIASSCPVALSVIDAIGASDVSVGFRIGYKVAGGEWSTFPQPRSVVRFINRFDSNKPVKPFNFYLDL